MLTFVNVAANSVKINEFVESLETKLDKHGLTGFESTGLVRRSDDFSEQFSAPDDPSFWIRLAKPIGEAVVVTDLLFGECDDLRMAGALGQALDIVGIRKPSQLIFQNLGHVDAPETAVAVQRADRVVEAFVMRQRRFIVGRNLSFRLDKVDLVVTFRNFG